MIFATFFGREIRGTAGVTLFASAIDMSFPMDLVTPAIAD
jgi:hypothetical protein